MQRRDGFGPGELGGDVPAGTIHDEHGMAVGGQLALKFVDQRLHGWHGCLGQDERDTGIALRTYGAEDPGCIVAHVAEPAWADAAIVPDAAGTADLADAGLILKP